MRWETHAICKGGCTVSRAVEMRCRSANNWTDFERNIEEGEILINVAPTVLTFFPLLITSFQAILWYTAIYETLTTKTFNQKFIYKIIEINKNKDFINITVKYNCLSTSWGRVISYSFT